MADTEKLIEHEFRFAGLPSIDAIERLQRLGFSPKDAEAKVEEWEQL